VITPLTFLDEPVEVVIADESLGLLATPAAKHPDPFGGRLRDRMRHEIPGFDHLASDWNSEGETAEQTYVIDCPSELVDPILETQPPEDVAVQQVGRVSRTGA
jgi:hypothetical protein